jgi:CubicO group peptidase (beta-lactamase class C family)
LVDKPSETSVGSTLIIQGGGRLDWYQLSQSNGGAWESFEPGSRRLYSNVAIGYTAALVEHITGLDFNSFCGQNIFDKLGMTHTAWFRERLPLGMLEAIPVKFESATSTYKDVGREYFFVAC